MYIDGSRLNDDILIHMPRLKRLDFNITTFNSRRKHTLPIPVMVDGIEHVFYDGRSHPFIRYYDLFRSGRGECQIYSIPYLLTTFEDISNKFPGGSFPLVRKISVSEMYDSFEHDFFLRISCSFPFVTSLSIYNRIPQKNKRLDQLDPVDRRLSPVQFTHLTHLTHLTMSHISIDYLEYFLIDINVQMPRLRNLSVDYNQLVTVTENFSRDATRRTCSNIKHLDFDTSMAHCQELYEYFPHCK